jgi:hypothetical protein
VVRSTVDRPPKVMGRSSKVGLQSLRASGLGWDSAGRWRGGRGLHLGLPQTERSDGEVAHDMVVLMQGLGNGGEKVLKRLESWELWRGALAPFIEPRGELGRWPVKIGEEGAIDGTGFGDLGEEIMRRGGEAAHLLPEWERHSGEPGGARRWS